MTMLSQGMQSNTMTSKCFTVTIKDNFNKYDQSVFWDCCVPSAPHLSLFCMETQGTVEVRTSLNMTASPRKAHTVTTLIVFCIHAKYARWKAIN